MPTDEVSAAALARDVGVLDGAYFVEVLHDGSAAADVVHPGEVHLLEALQLLDDGRQSLRPLRDDWVARREPAHLVAQHDLHAVERNA
ncbi:hypothetical protein [Modestobacter sp. Leaf380]|uniref:hypothetical protein n=1 Tax=Modestobacter sp. Leaf380 TaxID=1736356 RepID=UPI001F30D83C|nr:hypothetical protein [Modestobacter sp. Leaf380]